MTRKTTFGAGDAPQGFAFDIYDTCVAFEPAAVPSA
jgi:hypothetical protein